MTAELSILEKRCMLLERETAIADRDIKQLREQLENLSKLSQHIMNVHVRSSCVIDGIARLLVEVDPEHASKLEKYIQEALEAASRRVEEMSKDE